MKKVLIFLWIAVMMISVTSCTPRVPENSSVRVGDLYNVSAISDNLKKMQSNGGYYIQFEAVSTESDETETFACGANGSLYYICGGGEEMIFDLSSETCAVVYSRTDGGEWYKEIEEYDASMSREQMEETVEMACSTVSGYMNMYQIYAALNMERSTETVAGRECDRFTMSDGGLGALVGAFVQASFCIDKETGICLKWTCDATVAEESAGVSFTCTKFLTAYSISVPSVSEENTAVSGADDDCLFTGDAAMTEVKDSVSAVRIFC